MGDEFGNLPKQADIDEKDRMSHLSIMRRQWGAMNLRVQCRQNLGLYFTNNLFSAFPAHS